MRSRRVLVAAGYLSAALVSAPAFAGGDSGFYLGAGVGQASFGNVDLGGSSISFDGSDTSYKAIVGYNFGIIPLFDLGVEASYVSFGTDNFDGYDVTVMLTKAVLFGFIMSSISCYKGFTVQGGAVEIGKASTQAVVLSSIVMIVVNFFVAFFLL